MNAQPTLPTAVLGPTYHVWRLLQSGQERIIRFGRYREQYDGFMRHQNGHEHRCSVTFLFTALMIQMRPYGHRLDELLLTRCINHHDEPEGVTGNDIPATDKKDEDDLQEYLVFEAMYRHLGLAIWAELQEAFLLQFCLANPPCFPEDARQVMAYLALAKKNEALFFDGVQRMDYLYYALECYMEHGIYRILHEVAAHQLEHMRRISAELPGFDKVVWTPECEAYFTTAAQQMYFAATEPRKLKDGHVPPPI